MAYERYAWVEVDFGAVAGNVRALKGLVGQDVALMAVVKADGYGHGLEETARAALGAGAARLGVAIVEEALALRRAGILAPLQILSEPPPSAAATVVQHDLIPAVYTMAFAEALSSAAQELGKGVRCHLKVDTGMNRVGVPPEEGVGLFKSIRRLPGVNVEGTFTHFATADVPGDWGFSAQLERFQTFLRELRARGMDPGITHAANSAATILHPASRFDMVRCGIAIYGLHPSPSTRGLVELSPAMSVKARVAAVRRVGMGEGVSYGFTYHTSGPATLVVLPLGYGDGIHRVLSNRMSVLLGGMRCPQVGRICMDQIVVEAAPGTSPEIGDEAVLVGTQGPERIPMEEVAELAGTITYEIACDMSLRLPRRFV